jgi:hypothetical protein
MQQQVNTSRQMTEAGEYIALPIIPLTTTREKGNFIFSKINDNLCSRRANVNFNTKTILCEIPNCNKFHRNYRFNSNIRVIDINECRYDQDCTKDRYHQCKFIHSEQVVRWYDYYVKNRNIDKMNKLIFLEISMSIEKHYEYKEKKNIEKMRIENEIAKERREREREIQSRYEADRMRTHNYGRDRSRSRERNPHPSPHSHYHSHSHLPPLPPPPPPPPPPSSHSSYREYQASRSIINPQIELERLNADIEIAKKKKELAELSKMIETQKTQIDVNKMIEAALVSRMQTAPIAYQMPASIAYQQYAGYQYPSGASAYQYPSGAASAGGYQ